jgi:hypothetical protein
VPEPSRPRRPVSPSGLLVAALLGCAALVGACGDAPAVPSRDGGAGTDLGGADAIEDSGRDDLTQRDGRDDDPEERDLGGGGQDAEREVAPDLPPDTRADAAFDPETCPLDDLEDDAAADGDAGMDLSGDAPSREIAATGIFAVENPANVLSYYVEWRTPEATSTRLEVDCGDYAPVIEDCELREDHSVFLMGLYPGAECVLTTTGQAADGGRVVGRTEIVAGDVPAALPTLRVLDGAVVDELARGWTLINLNNEFDRIRYTGALIDEEGRYRWYHMRGGAGWGSDTEVQTVPEGVLFGGREPFYDPAIVDWEGTVVWSAPFDMHHDIQRLSPTRYVFLGFGAGCPEEFGEIPSDIVNIWDDERREVVWSWRICDHVTPSPIVPDWSHVNTVEPFLGDRSALLLSSRNQHTLYRLNSDTGEIEWSIGQNGSFTLLRPEGAPSPDFYRQHAPELVGEDRILLFDNGLHGTREFSRALELEYDTETETAFAVWEYVPEPTIFAPIWGDADRLPNGNTLVTFGLRDQQPAFISHIVEVSPSGEALWDLVFPVKWGVYRAERVADPPVGFVQ